MSLMDAITLKEKEAIDELKRRISDEAPPHLRNDVFLYLRFLRARDFNVNLAESMLRNHLTWRKANNIDTILTDLVPLDAYQRNDSNADSASVHSLDRQSARMGIVIKYFPITRLGFDKDGALIRYLAFGDMDAKGILKTVKKNECVKSVIRCFEEDIEAMKQQSSKLGKPIEQWIYILNFENYTFSKATHKPTLEALMSLFLTYEANYPERLKAAYVINASIYFTIAFAVIKPLLSGATLKKITIYGKDGWKDALLKDIDPEILPVFLGGKLTDPDGDPMCRTIIKSAELVPEEYFMTKSKIRLSDQPGVSKVIASRMSKISINLEVTKPDSIIEWEFETEGKDIGFGLFYKNSVNKETIKALVPNQRFDTQMTSEVGMYQCEWPGTYVIVFDNSYSWIHQKEIYYKVSVVHPDEINGSN